MKICSCCVNYGLQEHCSPSIPFGDLVYVNQLSIDIPSHFTISGCMHGMRQKEARAQHQGMGRDIIMHRSTVSCYLCSHVSSVAICNIWRYITSVSLPTIGFRFTGTCFSAISLKQTDRSEQTWTQGVSANDLIFRDILL